METCPKASSFKVIGEVLYGSSDFLFFPEATDAAQVQFYIFIATIIYLFLTITITFYIFYKIAMISGHKGFKNIFLFLMSLLLRIPFQSVEVNENKKLSGKIVLKEVWKELFIIILATVWLVVGVILGNIEISQFRRH